MKHSRFVVVGALAASMMLSAAPSDAGKKIAVRYYELSGGVFYDSRPDPSCEGRRRPCDYSKDGTIDLGGVQFQPINKRSRKTAMVAFSIKDDLNTRNTAWGGRVSYFACQDLNGNGTCGESNSKPPEPSTFGCSGGAVRPLRVRKNKPVTVFVRAAWGCPRYLIPDAANQQGVARSGKVTMRYF